MFGKFSMFELVISTYRRKTKKITLNLFKTKMNQFSFIGLFQIRPLMSNQGEMGENKTGRLFSLYTV